MGDAIPVHSDAHNSVARSRGKSSDCHSNQMFVQSTCVGEIDRCRHTRLAIESGTYNGVLAVPVPVLEPSIICAGPYRVLRNGVWVQAISVRTRLAHLRPI